MSGSGAVPVVTSFERNESPIPREHVWKICFVFDVGVICQEDYADIILDVLRKYPRNIMLQSIITQLNFPKAENCETIVL